MSKSTEKLFALRDVIRSMKLSSTKVNLEAALRIISPHWLKSRMTRKMMIESR